MRLKMDFKNYTNEMARKPSTEVADRKLKEYVEHKIPDAWKKIQ